MANHIEFCLDEIACEIDERETLGYSDAEKRVLHTHVDAMRILVKEFSSRARAPLAPVTSAVEPAPAAQPISAPVVDQPATLMLTPKVALPAPPAAATDYRPPMTMAQRLSLARGEAA